MDGKMQEYVIGQQTRIYIYGAGRVGRLIENLMTKDGYHVVAFIDKNAAYRHYKDYKIIMPDDFNDTKDVMIIVALAAENVARSVKISLEAKGYQNVMLHSDRRIQEQFCLHNRNGACVQCAFAASCQLGMEEDVHKVHINELSIGLTTKCSLNCKNCVVLTPKLKEQNIMKDLQPDDFRKALEILEQYIGSINEFVLGGGDPLLHKNIGEIIKIILESSIDFKQIRILTPGIVPISNDLMVWLKDNRIKITMDDYGDKLKERGRLNFQRNIEFLEKNQCNYEILDNTAGVWYDFGSFEDRRLFEPEIAERFEGCPMKSCIELTPTCYLGRCARHMIQVSTLGDIPGEKEYIDLLDERDMVKDKLITLLEAKILRACNFCNGCGANNVVAAGEQV
ncbi:MAG: radical SAM protein [Lachnospiraceae bacterium]|nr:radical SAM protein [Butyrivibrio sp.]MCM1342418.1 radical SAM protein [Muribaculaceae bacterium]MCM1410275.1 radical SAM protein [Lachnospiraceae bacterium]